MEMVRETCRLSLSISLTCLGAWKHGSVDSVRFEDRVEGDESLANKFFDFVRCALRWDPMDRCSAKQLLDHSWLK